MNDYIFIKGKKKIGEKKQHVRKGLYDTRSNGESFYLATWMIEKKKVMIRKKKRSGVCHIINWRTIIEGKCNINSEEKKKNTAKRKEKTEMLEYTGCHKASARIKKGKEEQWYQFEERRERGNEK